MAWREPPSTDRPIPPLEAFAHDGDRPAGRQLFYAVIAAGALAALWVRTGFPAHIIAGASADDALFVRLARSLLSGAWLGPFDNLTLVKGIGYPVFVALCFAIGIPVKIAETLVYLGIAAASACLVYRWMGSRVLGLTLFLGLAFNPILWSEALSRIIREGLYISLTLAALVVPMVLVAPRRRPAWQATSLALGTGLIWAWFWLTREEGVWLLPSIVIAIGAGLFAIRRLPSVERRAMAVSAARRLAIAAVVTGAIVTTVAAANWLNYGRFQTVEVTSTPFERAYGALYRVKPDHFRRYVVFPIEVRRKAYSVSPAARELAPTLDGASGRNWQSLGCAQVRAETCSEILSGWFQWAFRDAVAVAGYYRSSATAATYYTRLADEIDTACEARRLDCLPPRATLAPPFRAAYMLDALGRLPELGAVYWSDGLHVAAPAFSVVIPGEPTTDDTKVLKISDFVGSAQPTVNEAESPRLASRARSMAIWHVASIGASLYAIILCLLIAASPVGLVILLRHLDSAGDDLVAGLALACFVGVAARAALLTYLDVTAIPSVNILYASPASPLLIVAAILSTVGGAIRLMSRRNAASRARVALLTP